MSRWTDFNGHGALSGLGNTSSIGVEGSAELGRSEAGRVSALRPRAGDPWTPIIALFAKGLVASACKLIEQGARDGRLSPEIPQHVRARFTPEALAVFRRNISHFRQQGRLGR